VRKAFSWILCLLLLQAILSADAVAIEPTPPTTRHTVLLRKSVEKVGTGRDVLVALRLQDGSVVAGYMDAFGPFSLSITDAKTDTVHTIDYAKVDRMAAYNLVTGVQVEEGGGIRAKLARALSYVIPVKHVPANQLTGTSKLLLIGIVLGVIIAIVVAKTV
jgi:hypothetical protein